MSKDLPKSVPPAILSAAAYVLKEAERHAVDRRGVPPLFAAHRERARKARLEGDESDLKKMASDVFRWAVDLRRLLPSQSLYTRFMPREDSGPCLSIVDHTIELGLTGDAPRDKLRTELELCLYPDYSWLFRRYEWFNGFKVHGGDQLNTETSIEMGLHPKMLRAIHEQIAEGKVWVRVEHGLSKLLSDFKDG